MFSIIRPIAVVVGLAQVVMAVPIHYQSSFDLDTFHVSTPDTLHQCTPALFAWTPTSGPYYLTVTTSVSHNTDGDVVVIPHATSASWIVDVQEGQQVTIEVRDSEGRVAETITRTVKSGPSHCL